MASRCIFKITKNKKATAEETQKLSPCFNIILHDKRVDGNETDTNNLIEYDDDLSRGQRRLFGLLARLQRAGCIRFPPLSH